MGEYKNYRLLKDLPFAKAGEIFESRILDDGKEYMFWGEIKTQNIKNFDEWFEEIEEPKEYFYITSDRFVDVVEPHEKDEYLEQRRQAFGNYFETREEAGDCLAYLKARAIIKQDTKGFTPDWEDFEQDKFYASWDFYYDRPVCGQTRKVKEPTIYFKTIKDLEESLRNHPKEWKTYHTYNQ